MKFFRRSMAVIAILAGVLSKGDAAGGRPVGASPPGRDAKARFDRDVVNLWPLCYAEDDRLAILWPLFDKDAKGIAVRPFYFRQGEEQGILFPLSDWGPSGGRVLNGYWRADGGFGVFPLFQHGPGFRYYGPAWVGKSRKNYGFFPLAYFSPDFNYAGPLWWNHSARTGGFFPLSRIVRTPEGEDAVSDDHFWRNFSYVGPAWWSQGGRAWGFFPVGMKGMEVANVGPVWWDVADFRKRGGVFPLSYWSEAFNYAGPLWWTPEWKSSGFFPLVWLFPETGVAGPVWWKRGEAQPGRGVFPLAEFRESEGFVGPVWWDRSDGTFGLFPVFSKGREGSFAGPVWWRDREHFGLFPLFWRFTGGSAFFPLYYREDTAESRVFNLGGVFWHDSYEAEKRDAEGRVTAPAKSFRSCVWPLFLWKRTGERESWSLWPLVTKQEEADRLMPSPLLNIDGRRWGLLFGLGFLHQRTGSGPETPLPSGMETPLGDELLREPNVKFDSVLNFALPLLSGRESGRYRVWRDGVDRDRLSRIAAALTGCRSAFVRAAEHREKYGELRGELDKTLAGTPGLPPVPEGTDETVWKEFASRLPSKSRKAAESCRREREAFLAAEAESGTQRELLAADLRYLSLALPGDIAQCEALAKTLARYYCAEKAYSETVFLPLLFADFRYGGDRKCSWGPKAMLFSAWEVGEVRELRVLGFLYRERREGDISECSLPGIGYTSGPEQSRLSILAGLYTRETERGKSRGKICWIPWGDE